MPRHGVGHGPGVVSLNLWFVTPAWGRFTVSQLVFAQRRELIRELDSRGVAAYCVVIADDINLELAEHYGFETIKMDNSQVGRKVNAGIEFAARNGADYIAFVGSDDWMHPDLFEGIDGDSVIAGRDFTLVDLDRRVMTTLRSRSLHGAIPWLIPREALERCWFRPLEEGLSRGLDYGLYRQIRKHPWKFIDRHPHTLVDFKSDTNITPYEMIGRSIGSTPEQPLGALREWYPGVFVDLAEELV